MAFEFGMFHEFQRPAGITASAFRLMETFSAAAPDAPSLDETARRRFVRHSGR